MTTGLRAVCGNPDITYDTLTSVVTHILPEMSIQNMTRESSTDAPPTAPPPATGAGAIMYVVSSLVGISSGTMSISFGVPQNSHTHTCRVEGIG